MKGILILSLLCLLEPASAVCHACLDRRCHTKRKVFQADQLSGQIAIDHLENQLHLHYQDIKGRDHTTIVDLNSDILSTRELPIHYSFARAVDQNRGDIYFSGITGIYKYSAVTRITEPVGYFTMQIFHMQFKDNRLYFSEYQGKGLYYIESNKTFSVKPLAEYIIDDFIVEKHGEIFFTSYYLIYRFKKDDVRAKLFSTILYSLATDIYDNAFFLDTNGRILYALEITNYTLVKVGMFDEGTIVFRMAFDSSNRIIYCDASNDKVYILQPNNARCFLKKEYKKPKLTPEY